MPHTVKGNLLDIQSGVICHQVNCQGAFGAGIAGQISRKWPDAVRVYRDYIAHMRATRRNPLGTIVEYEIEPNLVLCHLFSQENYGNSTKTGRVYTDYDALENCLSEVRRIHGENAPVYVPYRIGCGLAGGNWDRVSAILDRYDVTVIRRPFD